jgi:hypothetical protein
MSTASQGKHDERVWAAQKGPRTLQDVSDLNEELDESYKEFYATYRARRQVQTQRVRRTF